MPGESANAAFVKAVQPDAVLPRRVIPNAQLAKIVGDGPLSEHEAMNRVWAYIDEKGLADPTNIRMIITDAALKAVVEGKSVLLYLRALQSSSQSTYERSDVVARGSTHDKSQPGWDCGGGSAGKSVLSP